MRLHLYTTDPSGLALLDRLSEIDCFTAVVVPMNRSNSDKVEAVRQQSELPVIIHKPNELLPESTPTADGVVSWLYSQIIAPNLLESYSRGGINMHGGMLPNYRGANVLNWAIANGEIELGVTWHEMVEQVDAGGIYSESVIPIGPNDTALDMRTAMIEEGIRLFPEALKRFSDGSAPLRFLDLQQGFVWPSRRPKDGQIMSGWSREKVWAMIRAQTGPWPDATVFFKDEWCAVCNISDCAKPGLIPYRAENGEVFFLVPSEHTT